MSKLSFALSFKTREFRNLDLPVEVRKPNQALVATTFSTKSVEVPAGEYFVSATLPAGQELYGEVKVGTSDVQATLAPEQESPHESHERQFYFGVRTLLGPLSPLETLGLEGVSASVNLLRGSDPKTAVRQPLPQVHFEKIDAGVQFKISGGSSDTPQFLEFLRPGKTAHHVAIPIGSRQSGIVVVRRGTTISINDLTVEVHIHNSEADLLLSCLSAGYFREASQAVNSDEITAEKLLKGKEGDPYAAAVGAYALLQFGELDRLHNWTENLMEWFPWLPDGPPIRAEHLARLGKHQEALNVLAQIPLRGVPQFSLGISSALNRLRIYTRATRTGFPPEVLKSAEAALGYLEEISRFVDFRRPVLTTDDLRKDMEYPTGADLGQYL